MNKHLTCDLKPMNFKSQFLVKVMLFELQKAHYFFNQELQIIIIIILIIIIKNKVCQYHLN